MPIHQEQRQGISQRIDPKIILANTLLQLTTMELGQSIENELLENPALEVVEEVGCEGNCIDTNSCPYCAARLEARRNLQHDHESLDTGDAERDSDDAFATGSGDETEDYDLLGNLEAETTLQQHLATQLHAAVSDEDYWIGEYLINCLDEKGWIGDTVDNIAEQISVAPDDVCRVLKVIQTFDPPGIAAQSLQECLLLQLRYLREVDPDSATMIGTAEKMILDHYAHFCASRYVKMARSLKIRPEDARTAVEYVRDHLSPFPAGQYRSPWVYRPNNSKTAVRPDIIVRRDTFGYEIDVAPDAYMLSVNHEYRDLYMQIKTGRKRPHDEEDRHILEYVERAERFIRTIHQRRLTLRQITRCIVDYQTGFMETGSFRFLRPLTRTQVAHQIGLHESTVSRATANKFVQLPNQDVISFDVFFDSSLSTKAAIESIIQEEDHANPLSDQELVNRLQDRGITVARRTIVKYRDDRKILSSNRRRR